MNSATYSQMTGDAHMAGLVLRPPVPQVPGAPAGSFAHLTLLPFDASDPGGGGIVHTTLPPEQVIPPPPNRRWWRGDFGGVTLDILPQNVVAQVPIINGLTPQQIGANTTPLNMMISFLLPWYTPVGQQIIVNAHRIRGYTHFHLDRHTWEAAGYTVTTILPLFQSLINQGFYVSWWALSSLDGHISNWAAAQPFIQPMVNALAAAGIANKCILIIGEELNSYTDPTPTGLDDIIRNTCALTNPLDMDTYLHFTSNVDSWSSAPFTQTSWWAQWPGLLQGLCWQSNANDTAGTMGGHLYDARTYLGNADPNRLRVVAFETRAFAELFVPPTVPVHYTEQMTCRTDWELICTTRRPQDPFPPVAGAGNGIRYPDGSNI